MSTQSNAVPDSPLESQVTARAAATPTRPMYWSIRRELWEYRSIYIAPLAVAGFMLVAHFVGAMTLPYRVRGFSALVPTKQRAILEQPFLFTMGLIMGIAFIVGMFYCLEALRSERRDRSILFWKSLPVSDLTTVLAKASIPLVVLPALTIAILFVTEWIMLLEDSVALLANGVNVTSLWNSSSLLHMQIMLLYHMVTVHIIWYAPIFAWLLLISAWAKRAAFLWAVLPPVAICAAEKLIFNTTHFLHFLGYRFSGPENFSLNASADMAMNPLMSLAPGKFLSTPGLWTGLASAAIFLAAAVRLRRYREPF